VSSIAKAKKGSSSGVNRTKDTLKTAATGESKKSMTIISKKKPPSSSLSFSSSSSTSSATPSKVLSAAELREARLLALSGE
jgi:hypothetical protein